MRNWPAHSARCWIANVRQRMGEAARKLALKHTLDRNCDQIVSIYQQIAGQKLRAA